jgi:hypothetical protein
MWKNPIRIDAMRESVNRSQIDIKRKICDTETWKKTFISRHILHQHWYTCPIALPVRRNPQRRSLLTVATSAPRIHHLRLSNVLQRISLPVVNRFTRQTLPTANRKHFFINIIGIESYADEKRTGERYSSVGHTSSMIAILTSETSLWTCACASPS